MAPSFLVPKMKINQDSQEKWRQYLQKLNYEALEANTKVAEYISVLGNRNTKSNVDIPDIPCPQNLCKRNWPKKPFSLFRL